MSPQLNLTVLPDGKGRVFSRNGIKNALGPDEYHVRWVVAELDGVRVYITDDAIVMTKRDMNP